MFSFSKANITCRFSSTYGIEILLLNKNFTNFDDLPPPKLFPDSPLAAPALIIL